MTDKNVTVSILGAGWMGFPLGVRLKKLGYSVNASTTEKEKISQFNDAGFKSFIIKCPIQFNSEFSQEEAQQFFDTDILVITVPFKRSLVDPNDYKVQISSILDQLNHTRKTKIIFTSSTAIYPNTNGKVTEATPHDTTNPRSVVLYEVEQLCMAHPHHKSTAIRFAGLIGPDRIPGRFFAGKKNIPNPTAPVNLIELESCLDIIQVIIEKNLWGEIFNGVGSEHPKRKDYYTQQAEKYGFDLPQFEDENSHPFKWVCNNKLRQYIESL